MPCQRKTGTSWQLFLLLLAAATGHALTDFLAIPATQTHIRNPEFLVLPEWEFPKVAVVVAVGLATSLLAMPLPHHIPHHR